MGCQPAKSAAPGEQIKAKQARKKLLNFFERILGISPVPLTLKGLEQIGLNKGNRNFALKKAYRMKAERLYAGGTTHAPFCSDLLEAIDLTLVEERLKRIELERRRRSFLL